MVTDIKIVTPAQKKTYRKHHRARVIMVDTLPNSKYIKIIDKSTAKIIFYSLYVA